MDEEDKLTNIVGAFICGCNKGDKKDQLNKDLLNGGLMDITTGQMSSLKGNLE